MLIKPFGKGYLECQTEEAFIEPYSIETEKKEISVNYTEIKKEIEIKDIKIKKEFKTDLYFVNVQNMNNLQNKNDIIQYLLFNKFFKFKVIDITKEMIYCGFIDKEEAMNFYHYYHKKPYQYKIIECKLMFL
jgi:hypothetical protein